MRSSFKCKRVTLGLLYLLVFGLEFPVACLWRSGWVRPLTALLAAPDSSVWAVVFHFLLSVGTNLGLPLPLGIKYSYSLLLWAGHCLALWEGGHLHASSRTHQPLHVWSGAFSVSALPQPPTLRLLPYGGLHTGVFWGYGAISNLNPLAFCWSGIPHDFCPVTGSILVF